MPTLKEDKRRRAIERQEARAKLTPQQQLKKLDDKFGEGKGATKERVRLLKLIQAQGKKDSETETKVG